MPLKKLSFGRKGPAYGIVARPDELEALSTRKVLVGGALAFGMVGQGSAPADFIRLQDRAVVGGLAALRESFGGTLPRLQLYAHPALLERRTKQRYALTTDAYLRWGLRTGKGTVILLGGIESQSGIALEVLTFRDGRLIHISERELPARHAFDFDSTADAILSELRLKYPGARIVFAAPLSDWERPDAEYIGAAPLQGLRFAPLQQAKGAQAYRLPLAVLGLGVLAYVFAIGAGWVMHRKALAAYEKTASDPAIAAGASTVNLDVLEQRRLFMAAERRQELLTNRGTAIIAGVGAVAGVHIIELLLPAPSLTVTDQIGVAVPPEPVAGEEGSPDVHMVLSVPRADMPALDQAKQVLRAVSRQTGMDLYLSHSGWREDDTTRTYNVEGAIR